MRNDTKVGVLVGLAVVVLASVYFYGSSREAPGDFAPFAGGEALQIPVSADRVDFLTDPNRPSPGRLDLGTTLDVRPRSPAELTSNRRSIAASGDPASPSSGRRLATLGTPDGRARSTPINRSEDRVATGPPTSVDPAGTPTAAGRGGLSNRPTRLRTAASNALTEATRERLASGLDTTTPRAERSATDAGDREDARRTADRNLGDRPVGSGAATPERSPLKPAAGSEAKRPRPKAASAWPKQHRIEYGDTLFAIAERYYGSGTAVSTIVAANPKARDPKRLKLGTVLVLPAPASRSSASRAPATNSRAPRSTAREYIVRQDDSFYTIAKHVYGDGRRWHELYQLNKALVRNNPKRLKPGMTIKLPTP